MFSNAFEFGVIDKSKSNLYVEGMPSGNGSVQGLYFKWHPRLKVQGKLLDSKVYKTAFRYWSKMYPECVQGNIVWVRKNGARRISTLKYAEDGTFVFELNSDWMKNHNISTRQDVQKLGIRLPVLLHEEFYKQAHQLASTFDYMPSEGHEQVRICRTQLLMYRTEVELIDMLLTGKQFDAEDRVMKVLDRLSELQRALKQFAPRQKACEVKKTKSSKYGYMDELRDAVAGITMDPSTIRFTGFSAGIELEE